jgi:hypothetical protein
MMIDLTVNEAHVILKFALVVLDNLHSHEKEFDEIRKMLGQRGTPKEAAGAIKDLTIKIRDALEKEKRDRME